MSYCVHCGAPNIDGARFCRECGGAFPASAAGTAHDASSTPIVAPAIPGLRSSPRGLRPLGLPRRHPGSPESAPPPTTPAEFAQVPAPPRATSGLAIASLVAAFLPLCGLAQLAGIGLGIAALVAIRRSGGRLSGTGLAVAGILVACGALFLALGGGGVAWYVAQERARELADRRDAEVNKAASAEWEPRPEKAPEKEPAPAEDAFEENDSPDLARPIEIGREYALVATDDDWFRIDLSGRGELFVAADWDRAAGDLVLSFSTLSRGEFGFPLATGTGAVIRTTPDEGTVLVRVHPYPPRRGIAYRLQATFTPEPVEPEGPAPAADDEFEENDSFDAARYLELDREYGPLLAGDEDWYLFDLPAEGSVAIDLRFAQTSGDIELALHDASYAQIGSSTSADDDERIESAVLPAGSYRVRVYPYAAGSATPYTLRVSFSPSGTSPAACSGTCAPGGENRCSCSAWGACGKETCRAALSGVSDDANEDNDTQATAWVITPGVEYTSLVCADDDWFRFDVSGPGTVTIDARFSHASGDLEMQLADPAGQVLAASASSDDDERIEFALAAAGSYYVRVYPYTTGIANSYSLAVSFAPATPCTGDCVPGETNRCTCTSWGNCGMPSCRGQD
ncbi:MAG: pre-peptidase C-terminal domain-containing protein [Planctomycetes bacterium]|nr:pre-peptidase C-terminal domain-containing protein [Planctomycetota bacterium]